MSDVGKLKQLNDQTTTFISQVDSYLNQKDNEDQDMHFEMKNFLNLLGRVDSNGAPIVEQPQISLRDNNSLSVIYSISSEGSSQQNDPKRNLGVTFREEKYQHSLTDSGNKSQQQSMFHDEYKFVQQQVQQMQHLINRILQDKQNTTASKLIYEITSLYTKQMDQIENQQKELLSSVVMATKALEKWKDQCLALKADNEKLSKRLERQISDYSGLNTDLDKYKGIENELKKSLEQAQSFNERLSKLLQMKLQEQKYKDNQCKQIQTQLQDLSYSVQDFQTQFVGINSQLKNLFERLQDLWVFNSENAQVNKVIEDILVDTNKFVDKISRIQSNNDSSMQTTILNTNKSKDKSLSDMGNFSGTRISEILFPNPQQPSPIKYAQTQRSNKVNKNTTIKSDHKMQALNQFRNHFLVTPQKVSSGQKQQSHDSSGLSNSYRSNQSSSLRKNKNVTPENKQPKPQQPKPQKKQEIESLYKQIFANFN